MDNTYKTSDQGYAGYLMLKGYYCVGAIPANKEDPRRKDFIFTGVEKPKELEDAYFRYVKEPFSARELNDKVRAANRIAKQGLTEEDMEKLRRG